MLVKPNEPHCLHHPLLCSSATVNVQGPRGEGSAQVNTCHATGLPVYRAAEAGSLSTGTAYSQGHPSPDEALNSDHDVLTGFRNILHNGILRPKFLATHLMNMHDAMHQLITHRHTRTRSQQSGDKGMYLGGQKKDPGLEQLDSALDCVRE